MFPQATFFPGKVQNSNRKPQNHPPASGCGSVAESIHKTENINERKNQYGITVIAMLDKAKELGCLAEVSDEGGFWQKRDLKALVQEIGSWNEMIAAFGGKLKDVLGGGSLGVQSPITQFPNFERLEAAGQNQLPPGFEKLAKLIGRFGRAVSATCA